MVSYGDAQDEPLEEWLELERVYDEIFYDNERIINEAKEAYKKDLPIE